MDDKIMSGKQLVKLMVKIHLITNNLSLCVCTRREREEDYTGNYDCHNSFHTGFIHTSNDGLLSKHTELLKQLKIKLL